MKKKLLAGILALALCSTNMPPQTIFAGEFTSGNPDVVSEEDTPEIFTNEEQEAAGETNEDLFVFSSEEAPACVLKNSRPKTGTAHPCPTFLSHRGEFSE